MGESHTIKYLDFEKDPNGRWYVILDDWEGDREELEMVMEADTMLDILSQGDSPINVTISKEPFENPTFELTFRKEEAGGGNYKLKGEFFEFPVWLCHVTKFVYGDLPKKLYCARNED